MTDTTSPPTATTPELAGSVPVRPFLPALVILFIGSGCAALVYEIVWLQMLGLIIGGSAISLGVLLGTFMGGMCLGSLLFPRLVSRKLHPLLVYGLLELAIGVIGLLELWIMPFMGDLYTYMASPGGYAIALRSVMAGICLLPPTMLMGATLPAIGRYVEASPKGVSWLGFFYGGNTIGAVFGCLLAGFYLLPEFDIYTATFCAAAINLVVALLAIGTALLVPYQQTPSEAAPSLGQSRRAPGDWAIYLCLGLSGLTGLGSEAIWTRELSLMLGATVYTFSNILAVFLLGLGIGSSVGSFIARSVKEPKAALGWCQFLLAASIAWAAYAISKSLPFWPIDLQYSTSVWYTFQVNLAQCFWSVFPGALLWGASFPLGLAALVRRGQDPGKLVGGLYAANTVGAIIGSLLFAMVIMQYFGSQNAQRILIGLCVLSGLVSLLPLYMQMLSPGAKRASSLDRPHPLGLVFATLVAVVAGAALIMTVNEPNWGAVAWGRNSATQMPGLYPGVLHKAIPLTAEETRTMEEATAYDFKTLAAVPVEITPDTAPSTAPASAPAAKTIQWKLQYTLQSGASQAKVDGWLKTREQTLISALRKRAVSADQYRAVLEANNKGLDSLTLVNGKLRFEQSSFLPVDIVRRNELWVEDHKDDLTAALSQRLLATGTASIKAYNNTSRPNRYCVYLGEGMNVSVAVTYDDSGYRYFHGAGKVQASSNPADMRLQRTLGHISALTNYAQTKQTPKDVLVVACGAGVTAGSFVPYGCNITIVDIEPMVPRYVTPQFADVNHDVIPPQMSGRPTGYKKTNVVIDDGRHFVRTTKEKYDVITSDPIDPWVKGCAALNTVEYYQMCKDHLKPGGIMALWIPFYESSEETSKSIIATFFKVFPNGIIWSNDQSGQGYDAVLFGSVDMKGGDGTLKLDIDAIQAYLDDPANDAIRQSLRDVGFRGTKPGSCEAVELLATYAGTAPRMTQWTAGTEHMINTDRNLRLQYIAGKYVNSYEEVRIFNNILRHYAWPSEIFSGTPERIAALKEALEATGRIEQPLPNLDPK